MSEEDRVRLHISPFSASLLDAVVSKTIQPVASGISYHATQTNPNKGFGYVELPKAEADRLKKKLHGLVLRGSKMSIEVAKPEKRRRHEVAEESEVSERKSKKAKKVKTPKADLTGYELPEGRSVKRGWTATDKDHKSERKQKREKSKYNTKDEKEMIFKLGKKNQTSTKASKPAKDGDSKKKSTKDADVVHEFEKNTKTPSFLRDEKAGRSGADLTFVDGQGWVDEDGNVVEPVKVRSRVVPVERIVERAVAPGAPKVEKKDKQKVPEPAPPVEEPSDDSASEEVSSESEEESDDDSSELEESEAVPEAAEEEEGAEEGTDATVSGAERQVDDIAKETVLTDEAMDVDVPSEPKAIHPLEALYKRRVEDTPKLAPINTSFSFFDVEGNDQDDIVADDTLPQTPFTKQDRQVRGLRSAAPTPDTAAIGRKFSFAFGAAADEDEDEDDDRRPSDSPLDIKGDGAAPALATVNEEPKEQSTFVKEFYEKRADMNRSWKQRRREAMKQQRQRENRRLSRKPL